MVTVVTRCPCQVVCETRLSGTFHRDGNHIAKLQGPRKWDGIWKGFPAKKC